MSITTTSGTVLNGLYVGSSTPVANQKGLLIDNKYFIPLVESSGTDTSDATAVASDIITGKTAYTVDGKVTGTLPKLTVTYDDTMFIYTAAHDGYLNAGDQVLDFSAATSGTASGAGMLQGDTAWVNGQQIVGEIPIVTASISGNTVTVPYGYHESGGTFSVDNYTGSYTVQPGVSNQTLTTSGKYMSSDVIVSGDANLVADNIKKGVSIFGVAGTYQGSTQIINGGDYYKCSVVNVGTSQPKGYILRMQFDGKDFTFTMEDPTKTGTERTWLGSNSAGVTYRLMTYEVNGVNSWALYSPTTSTYDFYANVISGEEVYTDPWDATNWFDNVNEYMDTGTVTWTVSKVQSENTWSGYKAVFDSTAGTWSFSDTVTEGLSYIGITPVVGKIYSADTTIQVGYIKLDGILNDETVKFLLYPKLNGTLEDVSAGGNGVAVTNTGSVAVENNRIVFGDGKALTIPANTLPNDIFVSGSPFIIEFQGIIPAYTSKSCTSFARKEGSMYYDRLDMYLNTVEGDSNYGQMTIGYWTNNVDVPVGAFTVGVEHVVAFEYDGNNTNRVYLDGVMQYSFTGTSYLPFRTVDFLIGHDTDAIGSQNGNPFQGNMSYFRIRNVAPYQGASYTPEWV